MYIVELIHRPRSETWNDAVQEVGREGGRKGGALLTLVVTAQEEMRFHELDHTELSVIHSPKPSLPPSLLPRVWATG